MKFLSKRQIIKFQQLQEPIPEPERKLSLNIFQISIPVLDNVDKETVGDNSSLRTLGKLKVFTNDQDGKDRDANNEDDVELAIHSDHLYQDGLNVIDRIYNPQEVIQPSNNLKCVMEKKLGNQYQNQCPAQQ